MHSKHSCARSWLQYLLLIGTASMLPQLAAETVAFVEYSDHWQVKVVDTTAALRTVLDTEVDQNAPAISPQADWIALEVAGGSLRVCPLTVKASCVSHAQPGAFIVRPVWRPEANELYAVRYVADGNGEDSDIVLIGEDAKIRTVLTMTGNQDYPDFSPDGKKFVFSSADVMLFRQASAEIAQNLWLADLLTGAVTQLSIGTVEDIHADWSPDGKSIAFASNRNGNFEIFVMTATGKNMRQVSQGPGTKQWPAWSAKGREIMYTNEQDGKVSLRVLDLAAGKSRAYTPPNSGENFQRRDGDWR